MLMRLAVILLALSGLCTAFVIYVPGQQAAPQSQQGFTMAARPDSSAYSVLKDSIIKVRDGLGRLYLHSSSARQKKRIKDSARHCFLKILQYRIFPQWYGTNWDFYGKTEVPRRGAIACGYFVATALRDMGLLIDRIALGDLPSESMIKKLIQAPNIKVFNKGQKVTDFEAEVKEAGDALYILGLDYHTGFLLCQGGQVSFINATLPYLMQQPPATAGFLAYSKYRVTGCLSADNALIEKWILKQPIH
jgi:hypothetical protein